MNNNQNESRPLITSEEAVQAEPVNSPRPAAESAPVETPKNTVEPVEQKVNISVVPKEELVQPEPIQENLSEDQKIVAVEHMINSNEVGSVEDAAKLADVYEIGEK